MRQALTADEKTLLETHPHVCKLHLLVDNPDPIFTAVVNQSTFSAPKMSIAYDDGSGSGVIAGMTLILGTAAGGRDLGKVRVKACTGGATGTITVAENSGDVAWADNAHISILPVFEAWSVFPRVTYTGGVENWFKDYNEDFVNNAHGQTRQIAPVAIMGPPAVAFLDGATIDVDYVGEYSYTRAIGYYGSGDMGLSATCVWSMAGGTPSSKTTLGTAVSPHTISYNAAGRYLTSLTVTNDQGGANAKSHTGYRYTHILPRTGAGAPYTDFKFTDLRGDHRSGGWKTKLRVYGDADISEFPDEVEVIIFAEEWFGDTKQSIGGYPGRENIKLRGWIIGETVKVDFDPEGGRYVEFDVVTIDGIMKARNAFPTTVEDGRNIPGDTGGNGSEVTEWFKMYRLQIDRAAYYLLKWHTTLMQMTDINILGDNTNIAAQDFPSGSIYRQLDDYSASVCMGRVLSDKQSSIFIDRDAQYRIGDARTNIVELMKLEKDTHLREDMTFPRKQISPVKFVECAGVHWDGRSATPIIGQAPGGCPLQDGQDLFIKGLALDSPSEANDTAGYVLDERNTWKGVRLKLAGNYSFCDIAPQAWFTMDIAAADNKRGIVWTDEKIITRSVVLSYDPKAATILTEIEIDSEATGSTGVTGDYEPPEGPPAPPGVEPWKIPGWNGFAYLGTENGVYSRLAGKGYWELITQKLSPFDTEKALDVYDMCFNPHQTHAGQLTELLITTNQGLFRGTLSTTTWTWSWAAVSMSYPSKPAGWTEITTWDTTEGSAGDGYLYRIVYDRSTANRFAVFATSGGGLTNSYIGVTEDDGATWTWLPLFPTWYDGSTYYRPVVSVAAKGGRAIDSNTDYVDITHVNQDNVTGYRDAEGNPLTFTAKVDTGVHPVLDTTHRRMNFAIDLGANFQVLSIDVQAGMDAGFKVTPYVNFMWTYDSFYEHGAIPPTMDSDGYGYWIGNWFPETADGNWINPGAIAWSNVWTQTGTEEVYARWLLFRAELDDDIANWVDGAKAYVQAVRITHDDTFAYYNGISASEYPSLNITNGPSPQIVLSTGGYINSQKKGAKAAKIFTCTIDGSEIVDAQLPFSTYRSHPTQSSRIFCPPIPSGSTLTDQVAFLAGLVFPWDFDSGSYSITNAAKTVNNGRDWADIENPSNPWYSDDFTPYDIQWLFTDDNDIMAIGRDVGNAPGDNNLRLYHNNGDAEWDGWGTPLPVPGTDDTSIWTFGFPRLARHGRTSNILMVISPFNSSVVISLDTGVTWKTINEGLPANATPVCGLIDWCTS